MGGGDHGESEHGAYVGKSTDHTHISHLYPPRYNATGSINTLSHMGTYTKLGCLTAESSASSADWPAGESAGTRRSNAVASTAELLPAASRRDGGVGWRHQDWATGQLPVDDGGYQFNALTCGRLGSDLERAWAGHESLCCSAIKAQIPAAGIRCNVEDGRPLEMLPACMIRAPASARAIGPALIGTSTVIQTDGSTMAGFATAAPVSPSLKLSPFTALMR